MSELDVCYIRLMHHGLNRLRDTIAAGDSEWAYALAELLHNMPSLIGEANPRRHKFFWRAERMAYLEWLEKCGNQEAKDFTRRYFEPIFHEMEGPI